jgi:hypothetical protein
MSSNDTTLCTTAGEYSRRTTWTIKNFNFLMQEVSSDENALYHPKLNIRINPSEVTIWNIRCDPNDGIGSGGSRMRLRVYPTGSFTSRIHASVAAKLLDSAGTSKSLGKVTDWFDANDYGLEVNFAHEKLLSSAERLMPGGTLTIYIEIKILPSLATVVHGTLQDAAPPTRVTPKNVFADMVDSFVDMKLNSILLIFENGEQKCHAFPLAARSDVLRTMLAADMREGNTGRIEMKDVRLETGRNLLFFLYNGWLDEGADFMGLLPLADQ